MPENANISRKLPDKAGSDGKIAETPERDILFLTIKKQSNRNS